MSRAEQFFEMCTTLPFEEFKDERDESSVPEMDKIAAYRDAGQIREAVEYGIALMKMFKDFDLIPFMLAHIYYQKGLAAQSRQIAIEAVPKCLRKYRLYSLIGLIELAQNRLPDALVWWSRSVIAQCHVSDFREHAPFLHLAYAANIVGAEREAATFLAMSDAIDPGQPRLPTTTVERLRPLRQSWVNAPLVKVLRHIDMQYLSV